MKNLKVALDWDISSEPITMEILEDLKNNGVEFIKLEKEQGVQYPTLTIQGGFQGLRYFKESYYNDGLTFKDWFRVHKIE